jgi:hypothetical protein
MATVFSGDKRKQEAHHQFQPHVPQFHLNTVSFWSRRPGTNGPAAAICSPASLPISGAQRSYKVLLQDVALRTLWSSCRNLRQVLLARRERHTGPFRLGTVLNCIRFVQTGVIVAPSCLGGNLRMFVLYQVQKMSDHPTRHRRPTMILKTPRAVRVLPKGRPVQRT